MLPPAPTFEAAGAEIDSSIHDEDRDRGVRKLLTATFSVGIGERFQLPSSVPSALAAALTKGMAPLPKGFINGRKRMEHKLCSFAHFLNLLWGPVIDFIEALDNGAAPPVD